MAAKPVCRWRRRAENKTFSLMFFQLAAFALALAQVDSAEIRPIGQLVHTRWTAKEGAPTDITTLAQTSDGYLWIGTLYGLVRFDGVRFVPFAPHRGDTLQSGGVQHLLASRDGSLWIVWRNGRLTWMRSGNLTTYGERDGLTNVFSIAESSTGTLVAGTAKGIARFADGKWSDVTREWGYPGARTLALWFDRAGALWAETENRFALMPAGTTRFVDTGMRVKGTAAIADFAQEPDGTVWVAELMRSAHTIPRPGDNSPVTEVKVGTWAMLVDRRGTLWIGSAGNGLRRVLDPRKIRGRAVARFGAEAETFTEKDGLLSNVVFALLEDREDNIWVATTRGLERFRQGVFAPIATRGPIGARLVFATRDTTVWSTTYQAGGVERRRLSETAWTQNSFPLNALAQDTSGTIWTVRADSIYRLRDRAFRSIPLRRGSAQSLQDITACADGSVFVFDTHRGLLRLVHDTLIVNAQLNQPGFAHAYVYCDGRGRVWVGQESRVSVFDHGNVRVYDPAKGEGPVDVSRFVEDRAGNVWVASNSGLSKLERDRFRTLGEHQGIPGGAVLGIVADDSDAFWMLTRVGVVRLPPGEADRALADSSYRLRYRMFDRLDGVIGSITGSDWGPLMARTADGRIWVATDTGIASVDPRRLPVSRPPAALIESVRINGREMAVTEATVVPPRARDIEVDFTAATLSASERIAFRYRLQGEDSVWREVGTRRRAYYTELAPGEYQFHVSASSDAGEWSDVGAPWSFRVLPAWYQTVWFRGGLFLLIAGLGALAAALVQRQRHWRAQQALRERFEATLAERSRIAQDLHDSLLQGFAGVTLQLKAAELALPERPDVAAETIMNVHKLARESMKEARERVWDLRDSDLGTGDLPDAIAAMARERTAGTGMELSLVTLGNRRRVDGHVEDTAFRIGREAVVNAVKHSAGTRIEIHLEFAPRALRLEVRDDGRGCSPEEAEKARTRGHFGLSGAAERAAHMGGRCEVRSRAGGGTTVALELPLSS